MLIVVGSLVVAVVAVVFAMRSARELNRVRESAGRAELRVQRLERFFEADRIARRSGEASASGSALEAFLALVLDVTGAELAGIWRLVGGEPVAEVVAGNDDLAVLSGSQLSLVNWAAEQRLTHVDETDSTFGVTSIESSGDSPLALVVRSTTAMRLDREALRKLLPRVAAYAGALTSLDSARREVQRQHAIAQALLGAAQEFQSNRTIERLATSICATALELSAGSRAALIRWHSSARQGEVQGTTDREWVETGARVDAESLIGEACRDATAQVWEDAEGLSAVPLFGAAEERPARGRSLAVVPLERDLGVVGAVIVEGDRVGDVRASDLRPLRLLAAIAAVSLEAQWEFDEVAERSRTDQLTGLANRRHFDEQLARMLAESDRFERPVSLVLADVDHFKKVNDTHGHDAGDLVLQAVATAIRESVRGVDVCARFGGEEIAVLLPGTSSAGAAELAERLRVRVGGRRVRFAGKELAVTASFGVATYPEPIPSRDRLFAAADKALYDAKRGGRDRVVIGS